nr:MAG TPA: hypothetical protein [Inoviridae sp.]
MTRSVPYADGKTPVFRMRKKFLFRAVVNNREP